MAEVHAVESEQRCSAAVEGSCSGVWTVVQCCTKPIAWYCATLAPGEEERKSCPASQRRKCHHCHPARHLAIIAIQPDIWPSLPSSQTTSHPCHPDSSSTHRWHPARQLLKSLPSSQKCLAIVGIKKSISSKMKPAFTPIQEAVARYPDITVT